MGGRTFDTNTPQASVRLNFEGDGDRHFGRAHGWVSPLPDSLEFAPGRGGSTTLEGSFRRLSSIGSVRLRWERPCSGPGNPLDRSVGQT